MLRNFWPAIVWALGILVLMGVPGTYFPTVTTFWDWLSPDKIVHFILFGGQTFLILYGFREQYFHSKSRYLFTIVAIGLGVFYGMLTELLQYYVFVGRYGSYFDFIADAIGAFIGFSAFYLLYRKKITGSRDIKNY